MKAKIPHVRIAAALGLAAGLMIGCQDTLGPGKTDDTGTTADEIGALSLSIRNDSACLGQWRAILMARSSGHPDSASEAAFLKSCVTEVKPGQDAPRPAVPPALLPDSGTRCNWIVSQIEGGRDSLTISYRKYCPDDCRWLDAHDSASHEKLCGEPRPHWHPDSLPSWPHGDSLPTWPHGDSLPTWPHGDSLPTWPHGDSLPPKPGFPPDTCKLPPPMPPHDDSACADLKLHLAASEPGTTEWSELQAAIGLKCGVPLPPPPATTCDELLKRLASLEPTSGDYAHLAATLKEHCPEITAH
jgi:hypothetical protein